MTDQGNSAMLPWPQRYSEVPKEVFQREDIYQRELERIFYGPEWHVVAHVSEVEKAGDFKVCRIGEAEVLVVRGNDLVVRVFQNSCPHRATQIKICGRGTGTRIECPYHRWQFNNQGDLVAAPSMRDFPDSFKKENYGLRKVIFEIRHGLIFASFSDLAPSIDTYLDGVEDQISRAFSGNVPLKLLGYQKVIFDSNWKEYGDQEGYHAPLLHKAFQLLQWNGGAGTRCITKFGHGAVNAKLKEAPKSNFLGDDSLIRVKDPSKPPDSTVIFLFPGTAAITHLDVISLRYFFPLSVHRTEVHFTYFARTDDNEEMERHRLRQSSNLSGPSGFISLEDGAVFNRLHRGSRTPGNIEFQKGVKGVLEPPCFIGTNDECGNLVKWERYRELMGFDRE